MNFRKNQSAKKIKKKQTTVVPPDYYLLTFSELHEKYERSIRNRYITEPIDIRRKLTKTIEAQKNEDTYSSIFSLLTLIENEMCRVISRRPAFYWIHIYRRLFPALVPELGTRTDATTAFEVRSHAEQAIFKFGSLSRTDGMASSDKVDFSEILGGYLEFDFCRNFAEEHVNIYRNLLKRQPQLVITDFSKRDIEDIYHIEGLAYQYWYITARLRSCGKGVHIRFAEDGELIEERTTEQDQLISSFDYRGERIISKGGFGTNVGTFVVSKEKNSDGVIITAALNTGKYTAADLGLLGVSPESTPNYLPFSFNAEDFYQAHTYLEKYFKKKFGFGLLEFCQISSTLSQILLIGSNDKLTKDNIGLFYFQKFQRSYKLYKSSLDDLKDFILRVIIEKRSKNLLKASDAENQIDRVIEFLTLDEKKQSTIGIWSHGPRFVIIKYGSEYFYDYSAWFLIFKNLFFGLKNYDPKSQKGDQFEYEFEQYAKTNGFSVVAKSKEIYKEDKEREIDVAIKLNNSLYIFECRAFEQPIDFYIGKPKTIDFRTEDLKKKVEQVNTLVEFIKKNKVGDNYDFSWAQDIFGAVVSPYTEWVWSLDSHLWSNIETFPRIMSAPEAILYLQEIRMNNNNVGNSKTQSNTEDGIAINL